MKTNVQKTDKTNIRITKQGTKTAAKKTTVPTSETIQISAEASAGEQPRHLPAVIAPVPEWAATPTEEPDVTDKTTPTDEPEPQTPTAPEAEPGTSEPTEAGQIHLIPLDRIRSAPFNPRTRYNENSIAELAASIARYGLLQPIGVRPSGDGYEIVFGERRYRAVSLLGHTVIKAYIRPVDDTEGRAVATVENIQREDMPPMDEARAFYADRVDGKEVEAIAVQYGKSLTYVYDRLCLVQLIPEIADLVQAGVLSIAMGKALARFGKELQEDIYKDHLRDGAPWDWRELSVKEFISNVERTYTNDLSRYNFDKEDCKACPDNASNHELFAAHDGCGRCTNEACLKNKNEAYLAAKAVTIMQENPCVSVCKSRFMENETVLEKLDRQGYTCKDIGYAYTYDCPEPPAEPQLDDSADTVAMEAARLDYEAAVKAYEKKIAEIERRAVRGEIKCFVKVDDKDARLVYVEQSKRVATEENFMLRMQEKKKRNEEIEREKVLTDTQRLVKTGEIPATDFTEFEEKTLYFYLLESLPEACYPVVGCPQGHYLSGEQKKQIIENLTPERKAIICRAYLAAHLAKAYGKVELSMLKEYAEMHYPKEAGIIVAKYEEERANRNARIDERIAEYKRQEKAKAKTVTAKKADTVPTDKAKREIPATGTGNAKPETPASTSGKDKSIPTPKPLEKAAKKTATAKKQKTATVKKAA